MSLSHQFLTLFWWEWLAYAFAFSSAGMMITVLARKKSKTSTNSSGKTTPSAIPATALPSINSGPERVTTTLPGRVMVVVALIVLFGLACGTAGYGVRDHQFISHEHTFFGVSVLSQNNEHDYTVSIPGYSQDYDFDFCHPLKMPNGVPPTRIDIRYEQRYGCKDIGANGFIQPHKENTDAELSPGRPTSSPETTARLEGAGEP